MADSKRDFDALLKRLAAPTNVPAWSGPPALAPGSCLDDTYRIVRRIGQGGMGEVYEAELLASGRRVALKCLSPALAEDAEARARFEAEARAASALGHPNIVAVLATGSLNGARPYLCMELLDGDSLQHELDRHGPLPEARLVAIASALCDALGVAHGAGLVHRDLKPANVMLVGPQRAHVKLTDFGVAKLIAQPGARLTTTGVVLGTPHFMAPEQVRGERHIDGRTDLFALGVLLYYCASGALPFRGKSFAELAISICSSTPVPVGTLAPALSAGFAGLIARAMERDPAQRFQSARELKQALGGSGGAGTPSML